LTLFGLLLAYGSPAIVSHFFSQNAKKQRKSKQKTRENIGGMIGPLVQRRLDNRAAYLPSVPVGHLTSFEIIMQWIILRALIDPGIELFAISLTDQCTQQALPKELGCSGLGSGLPIPSL
jgi:hypothetical protein